AEECVGHGDTGVQSPEVDIQFTESTCSISCKMNISKSKTIYWIKLLKYINDSFYDIVHIRRIGQKIVVHWFNCTDAELRFSIDGSNLHEAKLEFKLNSSDIRVSDTGTYKYEVHSGNTYWNTTTVDFAGCYRDQAIAGSTFKKPVFLYIILSLLLIRVL
ncbi:Hypothetical predicted protein, partial [Mytilus galloprovincialis]